MNRNLVMGIGNLLMTDDGIGVHAARALVSDPPPFTQVVDAGTDVFSALPFLANTKRAIIVDALRSGAEPGSFRLFKESELTLVQGPTSAHTLSLLLALRVLSPKQIRPDIVVLGVEPAVLDYGMEPSPALCAALPRIVHYCRRVVDSWNRKPSKPTPGGPSA